MKRREGILLILLGGAALFFVGRAVVQRYRASLTGYDNQIGRLEADLRKIDQEKEAARKARLRWETRIGPSTLSMDENEGMTRLRNELYELSQQAGLQSAKVDLNRTSVWMKHDIRLLNCTFSAEGALADVVSFFVKLHNQPYRVRVKELTIEQASKGASRADRDLVARGLLRVSARMDALVLPHNRTVGNLRMADLNDRVPVVRTLAADVAGHAALIGKGLFVPRESPVVAIATDTKEQSAPAMSVQRAEPERVVERPHPDAGLVLGRILSSPRGQMVVLENHGDRAARDQYRRVGEEVYDGVLVFVHQSGAVTERDGQRRFHALGQPLNAARVLTQQEQPEVYDAVMRRVQAGPVSVPEGGTSAAMRHGYDG